MMRRGGPGRSSRPTELDDNGQGNWLGTSLLTQLSKRKTELPIGASHCHCVKAPAQPAPEVSKQEVNVRESAP